MKLITLILVSVFAVYSEVFILNLHLKSVDRYISALKYQNPLIKANDSVPSTTSPYTDEDDMADELSLVPSEYIPNDTEIDKETQTILSDMYIADYTFNASEYNRVKNL